MGSGGLILIERPAALEVLGNLVSSPHHRVISLESNPDIESSFTHPDIEDSLHTSNIEFVIPQHTNTYKTITRALWILANKGKVVDKRRGMVNGRSPLQATSQFLEGLKNKPLHVARSGNRQLAYVVDTEETSRFVAHDVAEQLMVYKRDEGKELVVENFLNFCRERNFLGDVPFALMIHKLYANGDRGEVFKALAINEHVVNTITELFDQNSTKKLSLTEKAKLFTSLCHCAGVRKGQFDSNFLTLTRVPVAQALVFEFPSLFSALKQDICDEQRESSGKVSTPDELETLVLARMDEHELFAGQDPRSYIVLDNVTLRTVFIASKRKWTDTVNMTSPSEVLATVLEKYVLGNEG